MKEEFCCYCIPHQIFRSENSVFQKYKADLIVLLYRKYIFPTYQTHSYHLIFLKFQEHLIIQGFKNAFLSWSEFLTQKGVQILASVSMNTKFNLI